MCIRDRVVAATTAPHRDTRCMARIAASRRSGRVHAGPPPNLNARLRGGVKIPRPHRERDRMAPVSRAPGPRQFPLRPYKPVQGRLGGPARPISGCASGATRGIPDATGGPARPPVASSEMAWPETAACLLFLGPVAIGEGRQERDDVKLLAVGQSKIPHLGCVDVVGHFWRRPSRAGNVPRVVEVNDLLQRLEVAIVSVGFYEVLGGP